MRSSTWRPIFVSESEHSHETLMRCSPNVSHTHRPRRRARIRIWPECPALIQLSSSAESAQFHQSITHSVPRHLPVPRIHTTRARSLRSRSWPTTCAREISTFKIIFTFVILQMQYTIHMICKAGTPFVIHMSSLPRTSLPCPTHRSPAHRSQWLRVWCV